MYKTLVDTHTLALHLRDPDWVVVDCRFILSDPDAGRRAYEAGHIPGARNRPCASMVADDGRLLPAGDLRPLIRGQGERAQRPMVISCGSGVTACFGMLAARVAGLPDPVLYPGSFSDWVGAGMPVVDGSEPDGPIVNR